MRTCLRFGASLLLASGLAFGQSSLTPSGNGPDCTDPFNAGACGDQYQNQNLLAPGIPAATPTLPSNAASARGTEAGVYVDSSGMAENGNGSAARPGQRTIPPDRITTFQRLARESTGETLPVFGRELFRNPPSTYAPADQVAVLPDYVLGPGDELLLRIWGPVNFNGRLTVDRAGSVYVPRVGEVHVAGERFEELDAQLRRELNRTYRNFEFSVNLGRLRSTQVFVLGEAKRPGTYTLSALSTAFNALLISGGPSEIGSLRNIEVRRGGATIARVDLYDFVLHGDKSRDVPLQSGDVLFIPVVGPQVALAGSVRHPAIYEIHSGDTLGKVLEMAGGLSATAAESRLLVERVVEHRERHAMRVSLDLAGMETPLEDGDVIHADSILRGYQESVTLRGYLANPGRFPWRAGMKLSEILPDRESLLTHAYWAQRNSLGAPAPLYRPLPLNYRFFEPDQDYYDLLQQRQVRQQGRLARAQDPEKFLRADSRYGSSRNGSSATSAGSNPDSAQSSFGQTSAGGAEPGPDTTPPPETGFAGSIFSGLSSGYNNQSSSGFSGIAPGSGQPGGGNGLDNSDQSLERTSLAEQQQAASDRLRTAHSVPVEIQIPAPEIDWGYAVIERLDPVTLRTSLIPFNLGKLVNEHDPGEDRELQPGDVVTIVSQADIHVGQDQRTKYVRVEGEIAAAGVYSVGPDDTLQDVVRRAGGLTTKAYLFGASFTRESAQVLQQQRLNEYVATLSTELARASSVRAVSATVPYQATQEQTILDQLRRLRATGRVVLEFKPDSAGVDTVPALPLENGDVFRVPSRPQVVSVVGAVYGQNVFLFNGSRRVRDYLALAGKTNRIADKRRAFIIRADGSILSRDTVPSGLWSNGFESARVYPGDTIVVPEKPIGPSTLRNVIDWSQVFSQFAIGAAAIQVLNK